MHDAGLGLYVKLEIILNVKPTIDYELAGLCCIFHCQVVCNERRVEMELHTIVAVRLADQ